MDRDEYARLWSGGYNRTGQRVIVPDDVTRLLDHAPCFKCGQARDCKHRLAA